MIKVAFILGGFPKISETFILNQITGLIDLGHKVDIFAFKNPKEDKVHSDILEYKLLERTTYLDFDKIPRSRFVRFCRAAIIIIKYFIYYPKTFVRCLNFKKYTRYEVLNNLFKTEPFMKKRYDLIHCHFGPSGLKILFLKELMNKKIIVSFHGYDISQYTFVNGRNCYNDLFAKVDLITANSNYTKNKLIKFACDNNKISLLPMGLPVDKFKFIEKTLNRNERIKIITVARLVEKKGLEYSIKGIAKVVDRHPNLDIEYIIIGDGYLRDRLTQIIVDLKMVKNIKLLRSKTNEQIIKHLEESHIFILTSITADNGDEEGQGLVLQEAQASGLPVIATNHNGFPDSLLNGKTGYLVPEKDADAIYNRLMYLLDNPHIWPKMGCAGREFVKNNFDVRKLNNKLVNIYSKIINR